MTAEERDREYQISKEIIVRMVNTLEKIYDGYINGPEWSSVTYTYSSTIKKPSLISGRAGADIILFLNNFRIYQILEEMKNGN